MTKDTRHWVKRACSLCEAACGLRIQVDAQHQRITAVEGDPDDSRSLGFTCDRAQAMRSLYHDPARLRRPLRKRADGGWDEITWEEGLSLAVQGLQKVRAAHGRNALGVYVGDAIAYDSGAVVYAPHVTRALDTTHVFTAATMDHFPKLVSSCALYGRSTILPVPDLDRCDYFLCLGSNPLVSQASLMSAPDMRRRIADIRRRDGKVVVVDPRRSETAEVADEHHFIRPGTDALLLAAMVQVIIHEGWVRLGHLDGHVTGLAALGREIAGFTPESVAERTGIAAPTIRRLTLEFATAARACCYGRSGTCTTAFGALTSYLIDVLGILTRHFDQPGSMMFPRPATGELEPGAPLTDANSGRWHSAVRGFPEIDGQLPAAAMAEEIDAAGDGRLRAMLTIAGNPVLTTPDGERLDRALAQLDFMLSVDCYINETSRHADLILPPLTVLETEGLDILAAGAAVRNFARWSPAVVEPDDKGMPQWRILLELAAGLNGRDWREWERELLARQAWRSLSRPGSAATGVSPEQALAQLDESPGPLRMFDLMLRAGPYGDGFDSRKVGLSLTRLRAADAAVDLGPLQPRLLDILRTPDGCVQLAPPALMTALRRLGQRASPVSARYPFQLVGRGRAKDIHGWLRSLPSPKPQRSPRAGGVPQHTLLMHPQDGKRLAVQAGDQVLVRSSAGSLRAAANLCDCMMPGVVSLARGTGYRDPPVQPSHTLAGLAHALVDGQVLDPLSGTAVTHGIAVAVEPVAPEPLPCNPRL